MIPIHTFILKNVNPPQKQKLQSLLPFELFRMIFVLNVLNDYLKISKGEEDMPSDHVGYGIMDVEQVMSTLMNFIYPTFLSKVLMEDL